MNLSKLPKVPELETLRELPKEQLVELIVQQQQVISQLVQAVNRLGVSVNLDSHTSSKPPSTDLLKKPEKKPKSETESLPPETEGDKRKPGGQPGHKGTTRVGFGRVDRYQTLSPEKCPHCGSQEEAGVPVSVQVQQVAQLVERPIEVVEYHRLTCQCVHCGEVHTAAWPESIVPGQDLGVSLQALLVWLGNYGHLSYEKQQELLQELGSLKIGVGTLQATNSRVYEAIHPSVDDLRDWVKQQPHVHVDETPWPVLGVKEWLWVSAGEDFCLFHEGDTRSRAELEQQLGESFGGVISTDDYSVYNGYPVQAQQKCLAHLRRHFKKVVKLGHGNNPAARRFLQGGRNPLELSVGHHELSVLYQGSALPVDGIGEGQVFLDLIDEAFIQHRHGVTTQDMLAYATWAFGFKLRLNQSIQQWITRAGYEAGKLLRCPLGHALRASLRDKTEQWLYFLDHPEVPQDFNQAERSLRLAVTKRKVSGGSRSMARFAQTADLLSVVQTCRRQGRSVMKFFQEALIAKSGSGKSQPSLLPQPTT